MPKINDSAALQSAYSKVASAGIDASTNKIATVLGDNVENQGDALNTFLGKNGIDTSSNSSAGKLLAADYTAINAATQGNNESAYAKATAQLAKDLSTLTGNSVTGSSGGLDTSGITPGGGVSDAVAATATSIPSTGRDGSYSAWLAQQKGSDDVKLTTFPGANTTIAVNNTTGKVAAFDSDTGNGQNLPSWAKNTNPNGTLILRDGSRVDLSKGTSGKAENLTAVSGTQISQDGKSSDDASKVSSYLGSTALPSTNLSVDVKHKGDDNYGFATLQPNASGTAAASYKNNNGDKYSADDLSSGSASVSAALTNGLNKAPDPDAAS